MDVDPQYVVKFLSGAEFPASKEDLVQQATQNGGDAYVRAAVKALPGQEYASLDEVESAVGHVELGDPPYSADTDAPAPEPTGS